MMKFFQTVLRTTDVASARAFYASVLGVQTLHVVPLHEEAVARGARPHWLGFIDVGDVDRIAGAFLARGATALGPKWIDAEGLEAAVVRDPGGAIIALARPQSSVPPATPDVAWYGLHTADVDRARADYGELLGWVIGAPEDHGSLGVLHPFAYESEQPAVGAMSDIRQRAGVHAHWLFSLRVGSLDAAIDAVRAGGGLVLGPMTLPSGGRVAVCDDPQGAAFALCE